MVADVDDMTYKNLANIECVDLAPDKTTFYLSALPDLEALQKDIPCPLEDSEVQEPTLTDI